MRRVLLKSGENQESEDRLSNLPNCLLLHILSCLDSKYAVQTCVLSKRWKFLWKTIPTLTLHASRFHTLRQFTQFVSKILALRDGSITLHALDLVRQGTIEPSILKRILKYACYDKTLLEKLGISVRGDSDLILRHVSLCKALTSLKLSMNPKDRYDTSKTSFPKSLDLPTLTSLDLTNFAFCGDENRRAEPFLSFTRLNCLSLSNCTIKDAEILNLSSETLVNLAIHRPTKDINIAIVNNPSDFAKIELYAPNLSTFTFTGSPDQKICGTGLSSAKQVNIHAIVNSLWKFVTDHEEPPMVLLSWLQDLVDVKSMTLSSTTLQVLFLVPDLSEVRLPSLRNLKSMKIELIAPISQERLPFIVMDVMLKRAAAKSLEEEAELRKQFEPCWRLDPIPDGVLNFLIQNSPSTNIDITSATPGAYIEYLKQGTEVILSRLLFGAPASSSTAPASAPASSSTSPDAPASSSMAPASTTATPNLHLCHASSSMAPVSASAPASSSTTPASTAAPASSSTAPASTALPASSAPPNLHLCHAEKDDKSSNEDKVELRQSNTDSSILDNGQ